MGWLSLKSIERALRASGSDMIDFGRSFLPIVRAPDASRPGEGTGWDTVPSKKDGTNPTGLSHEAKYRWFWNTKPFPTDGSEAARCFATQHWLST